MAVMQDDQELGCILVAVAYGGYVAAFDCLCKPSELRCWAAEYWLDMRSRWLLKWHVKWNLQEWTILELMKFNKSKCKVLHQVRVIPSTNTGWAENGLRWPLEVVSNLYYSMILNFVDFFSFLDLSGTYHSDPENWWIGSSATNQKLMFAVAEPWYHINLKGH